MPNVLRHRLGIRLNGRVEDTAARAEVNRELVASGAIVIPDLLCGWFVTREDAVGRPKDSFYLFRPHRAINVIDLCRVHRQVMVEPHQLPGVATADVP